ncbi:hypothetical protein H5T87_06745 [bacterium]|nr:hypothetical protein [bacterium]
MRKDPITSLLLILSLIGLLAIVNLTLGGKKLPAPGEEHTHSLGIIAQESKEEQVITPSSLGTLASLTPNESLGNLQGKVIIDAFVNLSDRHQALLVSELKSLVNKYPQLIGLRIFDLDTPEGLREKTRAAINAPGILINADPVAYKPISNYTVTEVRAKVLQALSK